MNRKLNLLLTIFRWAFTILCLLAITYLFTASIAWGNVSFLWTIVPLALWSGLFYRKTSLYTTIALVSAILVIICWVLLPDDNTGWQSYSIKDYMQKHDLLPVIPAGEDAYLAYQRIVPQIFDSNVPKNMYGDANSAYARPWNESDHPECAAWLDQRSHLIQQAIGTCFMRRSSYRYSLNIFEPNGPEMMGSFRHFTYVLGAMANRDFAQAKFDSAVSKLAALQHFSNQLKQDKSCIGFMTGVGIEALALSNYKRLLMLHPVPTSFVENTKKHLPGYGNEWPQIWQSMLDSESLSSVNFLSIVYEIHDSGKIRFARNPNSQFSHGQKMCLQNKYYKALVPIYYFTWPHDPEIAITYMRDELNSIKDENLIGPDTRTISYSYYPGISQYLLYGPAKSIAVFDRNYILANAPKIRSIYFHQLCEIRGLYILIELKRYHDIHSKWPQDLKSLNMTGNILEDPFTGKPLIYKTKGNDFILYSTGPNKIDNNLQKFPGGKLHGDNLSKEEIIRQACEASKDYDDYPIWPAQ